MKNKVTMVVLGLLLITATNSFSQEKTNVINVQGEAIFKVTPEIFVVNIPIQIKDSVYENCTKLLVAKYNQLKNALVKNKIKAEYIQSNSLSVNESYIWDERERKFDGYVGNIQVTVEQEYTVEKLSAVIETLKNDEFKFGYNISFKLSEKQKSEQLEKAINMAVEDASNKAKMIAKAMDIKLGEIHNINFGTSGTSHDFLTVENDAINFDVARSNSKMELNLNPQLIEIQKRIGIVWEIIQ